MLEDREEGDRGPPKQQWAFARGENTFIGEHMWMSLNRSGILVGFNERLLLSVNARTYCRMQMCIIVSIIECMQALLK